MSNVNSFANRLTSKGSSKVHSLLHSFSTLTSNIFGEFVQAASRRFVGMAAIVALTGSLMDGPIDIIYSFLDESSVAAAFDTGANDIANLNDIEEFDEYSRFGLRIANCMLQHYLYHGSLYYE